MAFFNYKGRIGRKKYFLISLLILILGFCLILGMAFTLFFLLGHFFSVSSKAIPLLTLPGAALSWMIFSFPVVKRLHDIGFSGWFYLLVLLQPAYTLFRKMYLNDIRIIEMEVLLSGISLLILLVLLFKKGTKGPNKYGPDPLELSK